MKVDLNLKYELDHIGIAVESLEESCQAYQAMGFDVATTEEVADQKVRVAFLPLKNGCNIELLETTDETGPIGRFLKKRGPGMHHLCLRVEEINEALQQLKDQGVRLIDSQPRRGAHNCLVAFVHPSSTGGVLVELSQKMES